MSKLNSKLQAEYIEMINAKLDALCSDSTDLELILQELSLISVAFAKGEYQVTVANKHPNLKAKLQDIFSYFEDAELYATPENIPDYKALIAKRITEYTDELKNLSKQKIELMIAEQSALLLSKKQNAANTQALIAEKLLKNVDQSLSPDEIQLLQKHNLNPYTKRAEINLCVALQKMLKQILSLIDKMYPPEGSNETVDQDAIDQERIDINIKFNSLLNHFLNTNNNSPYIESVDYIIEQKEITRGLLGIFNGSLLSIAEFLMQPEEIRQAFIRNSLHISESIDIMTSNDLYTLYVPALALRDKYQNTNSEHYDELKVQICSLFMNNNIFEHYRPEDNCLNPPYILDNYLRMFTLPGFNISEFKQYSTALKFSLLLDKSELIYDLTCNYALPLQAINLSSRDFLDKLEENKSNIKLLLDNSNINLKNLLAIFASYDIIELLESAPKIKHFISSTGISLEELIALPLQNLKFILNHLQEFELLLNYYLTPKSTLHTADLHNLSCLLADPQHLLTMLNPDSIIINRVDIKQAFANYFAGIMAAINACIATDNMNHLNKCYTLVISLIDELRSKGINLQQTRAVYTTIISINDAFIWNFIEKFTKQNDIESHQFPRTFDIISLAFDRDSAVCIAKCLVKNIKLLTKYLELKFNIYQLVTDEVKIQTMLKNFEAAPDSQNLQIRHLAQYNYLFEIDIFKTPDNPHSTWQMIAAEWQEMLNENFNTKKVIERLQVNGADLNDDKVKLFIEYYKSMRNIKASIRNFKALPNQFTDHAFRAYDNALFAAIYDADIDTVKHLIKQERGIGYNQIGNSYISCAIQSKNLEIFAAIKDRILANSHNDLILFMRAKGFTALRDIHTNAGNVMIEAIKLGRSDLVQTMIANHTRIIDQEIVFDHSILSNNVNGINIINLASSLKQHNIANDLLALQMLVHTLQNKDSKQPRARCLPGSIGCVIS